MFGLAGLLRLLVLVSVLCLCLSGLVGRSCFWCLLLDLLLQSMCLCLGFCCCALVHDVLCLGLWCLRV